MNQWREAQNRCQCEIERLQAADRAYREEGVQLLELARNAQRLFEQRGRRHKIMVPTNCLAVSDRGDLLVTSRFGGEAPRQPKA